MKRLSGFFLVLFCFLAHAYAQEQEHIMTFEGTQRSYLLHVPPRYNGEAVPLVLLLHGRSGSGAHIASYTAFSTLADEHTFIALYPDGIDAQWNYVKDVPGYSSMTADDTAFLLALLDEVSSQYSIDEKRIYVAGFSNGGFMTQRLACDAPERFAAFASVAAAGFGGMQDVCDTPTPVSMLLIHGTLDAVVPWQGMVRGNLLMLAPVADTMAFWAKYASCEGEITDTDLPQKDDAPETSVTTFSVGCAGDNEVMLYAVKGGGHNWPGKTGIREDVAGNVTMDIDASEVIWEFFSRHQKQ